MSREYSIRKIIFLIFVVIAIIGIVFVATISLFFYRYHINHLMEERVVTLEVLSNTIAGPSWTVANEWMWYPGTIENIIQSVLKTPGIKFVRIVDEENNIITKSTDGKEVGTKANNLPPFEREIKIRDGAYKGEKIKEFSVKARDSSSLWMGISLADAKKEIINSTIIIGAITLLLFTITLIGTLLLVKKIMIKPLITLMDSFDKLKNAKYDNIKLEKSSVREVQSVFNSFGQTAKRIEKNEALLAEDLKRIKELDKMKSEFISTAAHQLRTPLSAVKWILQMIIAGDLGYLSPEQKTFLMQGYQSNERMINLVNDFLNVARIEEGRFNYQFSLIQLEDLIDNVIQDFTHELKEKKIKLHYQKPVPRLPKLNIDPAKMRLALGNLIDNAIKYTPKRGEVTISFKYSNMNIETAIKDSGMGIPEDQQNKLFTKFFRGDNAVRAQTEGSGLGLFIVKNIIEKHGGKIWLTSAENKGTTFYFTLPTKL